MDGTLWRVVESDCHSGGGKTGTMVHVRLRCLDTGNETVRRFRADEKVENVETEIHEMAFLYRDGDDLILRKRPGRTKYGNITLKKGYLATLLLYDWRQGIVSDAVAKKKGRIALVNDEGQVILRYNFFEAWPSKWKGCTLDGKGNDVFVEEIELAVEKLERE